MNKEVSLTGLMENGSVQSMQTVQSGKLDGGG
jgi:hypothetical protein